MMGSGRKKRCLDLVLLMRHHSFIVLPSTIITLLKLLLSLLQYLLLLSEDVYSTTTCGLPQQHMQISYRAPLESFDVKSVQGFGALPLCSHPRPTQHEKKTARKTKWVQKQKFMEPIRRKYLRGFETTTAAV